MSEKEVWINEYAEYVASCLDEPIGVLSWAIEAVKEIRNALRYSRDTLEAIGAGTKYINKHVPEQQHYIFFPMNERLLGEFIIAIKELNPEEATCRVEREIKRLKAAQIEIVKLRALWRSYASHHPLKR